VKPKFYEVSLRPYANRNCYTGQKLQAWGKVGKKLTEFKGIFVKRIKKFNVCHEMCSRTRDWQRKYEGDDIYFWQLSTGAELGG
jgi:hypothetical protein